MHVLWILLNKTPMNFKSPYFRVFVILLILISCLSLFRGFDSSIILIAKLSLQLVNSFLLLFLVFILFYIFNFFDSLWNLIMSHLVRLDEFYSEHFFQKMNIYLICFIFFVLIIWYFFVFCLILVVRIYICYIVLL